MRLVMKMKGISYTIVRYLSNYSGIGRQADDMLLYGAGAMNL